MRNTDSGSAVTARLTASDFARASLRHDWEFATHRSAAKWRISRYARFVADAIASVFVSPSIGRYGKSHDRIDDAQREGSRLVNGWAEA
jgi:hypothetical protein